MILIVQSLWNESLTHSLAEGAQKIFKSHDILSEIIQVPGTWEIPLTIEWAAQAKKMKGAVACGVIIKGETGHFDVITNEVGQALMQLSLKYQIPIGNALLPVMNVEQAIARAGGKKGNKGEEAALAVINMLELKKEFSDMEVS